MNRIITILLFGSIWGLFEATLGGALHMARLPFTGTIMASIGFSVLYGALRAGLKPSQLFAVGLVAASFKFLDSPLFGLMPLDRSIVNPAIAIATQGLACAIVLRKRSLAEGWTVLGLRFLGAAAISVVAFNAISAGALGWQTNHTKDILSTALIHLPLMAAISTALSRAVAGRVRLSLGAGWQAAATACAIALICAVRLLTHP